MYCTVCHKVILVKQLQGWLQGRRGILPHNIHTPASNEEYGVHPGANYTHMTHPMQPNTHCEDREVPRSAITGTAVVKFLPTWAGYLFAPGTRLKGCNQWSMQSGTVGMHGQSHPVIGPYSAVRSYRSKQLERPIRLGMVHSGSSYRYSQWLCEVTQLRPQTFMIQFRETRFFYRECNSVAKQRCATFQFGTSCLVMKLWNKWRTSQGELIQMVNFIVFSGTYICSLRFLCSVGWWLFTHVKLNPL